MAATSDVTAPAAQGEINPTAEATAPQTAPAAPSQAAENTSTAATGVPPKAEPRDMDRINGKYVMGYIKDTGKILASPLHWDGTDWAKAGAVVAVTGGLFFADSAVRDFSQKNKSSIGNGLSSLGDSIGDPFIAPAYLGSFYLYGIFKDDAKARRTSLLALESLSLSSVFVTGLKNLTQRHRPETGDGPGTFDGPVTNLKNLSFVSGHTANAFAIATVFANEYKDNKFVPPIAYGLATLTGLARIYDNKHWASDVFLGGAIGYFTSKALLAFHKDKGTEPKLSFTPQVGKDMYGLQVGYKF